MTVPVLCALLVQVWLAEPQPAELKRQLSLGSGTYPDALQVSRVARSALSGVDSCKEGQTPCGMS